jgi:uncharacterized protein (TIGR00725 family)
MSPDGLPFKNMIGFCGSWRLEGRGFAPAVPEKAEALGAEIAARGKVLVTGGSPGLVEAARKGAWSRGGLTVGILPEAWPRKKFQKERKYISIPIYCGGGIVDRVTILANTVSGILCVGGSAGTLHEIVCCYQLGKPVVIVEETFPEGCIDLACLPVGVSGQRTTSGMPYRIGYLNDRAVSPVAVAPLESSAQDLVSLLLELIEKADEAGWPSVETLGVRPE